MQTNYYQLPYECLVHRAFGDNDMMVQMLHLVFAIARVANTLIHILRILNFLENTMNYLKNALLLRKVNALHS